jgi:exodeoxyribonuclease V alpha subunit
MASISGRVIAIRHKGEDFWVFTLLVDEASPAVEARTVTVTGSLFGLLQLTINTSIGFVGSWSDHPKFGRQFTTAGWVPYAKSPQDMERFLNECIPGFNDPAIASAIVTTLGDDTFNALLNDQARVQEIYLAEDPRRERLDEALIGWTGARSYSDLSVYLQDFHVDSWTVRAIQKAFGSDSIQIIRENPYRLVVIEGFSFALADRLAFRQGFAHNAPQRFEGAILSLLRQEANNGHLYLRRGDLPDLLDQMMQREFMETFDVPDVTKAILAAVDRMVAQGTAMLDPQAGVYLPTLWEFERGAAEMLSKFISRSKLDIDLDAFVSDYERVNRIELSTAQRDGIRRLVENRALVLTGLPGTGKTTLVRAFVRLFQEKRLRFVLMAPTGIAAKRLSAVTGADAGTIHRTFGYDGSSWEYSRRFKYGVDAVIVDEMSMVDMELFYRIEMPFTRTPCSFS